MTKTFQHSYQVQQGEKVSERASCRYRTQRPEPPGPEIVGLPNNEWGYILFTAKELLGYLREEFEGSTGLTESDRVWIRDRVIEAGLLIDLIEGPEFRRGFLGWIESVENELELIHERQSPKLL